MQGTCLYLSVTVWLCRKTQASFELSAVGGGSPAAAKHSEMGERSLAFQVDLKQR